jgi:hypothetical protein
MFVFIIPKSLAPEVGAIGIELREKDILIACTQELPTSEVHTTVEVSCDRYISRSVEGDTPADLVTQATTTYAPYMVQIMSGWLPVGTGRIFAAAHDQ